MDVKKLYEQNEQRKLHEQNEQRKRDNLCTVPTKKYPGKRAYHKGCFGKAHAEKKGYKPLRFKKDFTVDRRYS